MKVTRPHTSVSLLKLLSLLGFVLCAAAPVALARDLRITIPRHSQLTPVQRFNREGVAAIRKHDYAKAEALFYKAYLYDPADPFTLNNLGYISELQGNLDRAVKFYNLAVEQGCEAIIAVSNKQQLQGRPMMYALEGLKNEPMRVNRMNIQAIEMLSQKREFEAASLLTQALALDPENPFTLNNLGVAEEATGDFVGALKYYDKAAASGSEEPIVVTPERSWRGKPIAAMAAESAQVLRKRVQDLGFVRTQATMLAIRGVSAANQNDWDAAKRYFLEAYSLDPNSAFALNNRGYVAEREGDLETAQFYYAKARKAGNGKARVGLATQVSAEGLPLDAIASDSEQKVNSELDVYSRTRRGQQGPIELVPRNGNPAKPGTSTPNPPSGASPAEPPSPPRSPQ